MTVRATDVEVVAFYRFVRLDEPAMLREPLLGVMERRGVRGTILLAREGYNGTIAGPPGASDAVLDVVAEHTAAGEPSRKRSWCDAMPFRRTRVRIKREIVSMGHPDLDPSDVGQYVEPEDWNALIGREDVTLIDTRNVYETSIGTFEGAVDPGTENFRDFPTYVDTHLDPDRGGSIAMFCTGGIRCEKATAYLRSRGFENVYHLRGGILEYLRRVEPSRSRWRGDCFVFDERVAVDHDLRPTDHVVCYGCGWPVDAAGQADPRYRAGVHCPHCIDRLTDDQKRRFETRHTQMSRTGTPG